MNDLTAYEYNKILPMYEIRDYSKIVIKYRVEETEKSYILTPGRGGLNRITIPKSQCKSVVIEFKYFEAYVSDWFIDKKWLKVFIIK